MSTCPLVVSCPSLCFDASCRAYSWGSVLVFVCPFACGEGPPALASASLPHTLVENRCEPLGLSRKLFCRWVCL